MLIVIVGECKVQNFEKRNFLREIFGERPFYLTLILFESFYKILLLGQFLNQNIFQMLSRSIFCSHFIFILLWHFFYDFSPKIYKILKI